MNGTTDSLYNVYTNKKKTRVLSKSPDRKYKIEDARAKKFAMGRFLDYKIMDSKTVANQVQEIQVILHEMHVKGMMLSGTFQVVTIIEKLPPGWKDFKNYLKHKRKEMCFEDLIIILSIEEDNRRQKKKLAHNSNEAKANKMNLKGKCTKLGPKQVISKKQKFQGKCFNCGKQGHKLVDCRLPKRRLM